MRFKYKKVSILLSIILLMLFVTPASIEVNYQKTDPFQVQYGLSNQKLYVSSTPSLYNYYNNMSHAVSNDSDYANFVTPQAVEPIAESILNLTSRQAYSNETFANAVLKLVHQIPYSVSDVKYPVETIVNNFVATSLLAASIMKAGGLDVVLIHYTGIDPGHMNVGVYLPNTPMYHTTGMAPTDIVYNNKTYWTAEANPALDWKVGDQSTQLADANAVIIALNDTEQSSPAQATSRLGTPQLPSSVTVNVSQEQSNATVVQEQTNIGENTHVFNITGSISQECSGQTISIYVNNGSATSYFKTVTDDAGYYMLTWNFTHAGTYYITSSWSGDSNYTGADSETLTIFVGPESFIQFQTAEFNYIFEQETLADYAFYQEIAASEFRLLQGVKNFDGIPLETNVSLSYDFLVMQAGQTVSNVQAKTITVPGAQKTLSLPGERYLGSSTSATKRVQLPAETLTVPSNVPTDMEALTLPDDFNQTINDQFCFILQNKGGNYSINVSALNDYEMSNITLGNESNISFLNASESIKENTWYNITESITENKITANLFNSNGTLIGNIMNQNYPNTEGNKTIILITNNLDNAVIFKDLTVQSLNNTTQIPQSNEKTSNESNVLVPYILLSILLVVIGSAALVYLQKKRQIKQGM